MKDNNVQWRFLFIVAVVTHVGEVFSQTPFAEQRSDYINGMLTENAQLIIKHYDESAELVLQANPTITGVTNAKFYFEALFREFEVEAYERTVSDILDMGPKKAETGNYSLRIKNPEGVVRTLTGSYLTIWKAPDNNVPKLELDFWNFDHHIDFSNELQFKSVPSTITAFEAHLPITSPASMELAAYGALINETVLVRDGAVLSQFYTHDGVILRNSNPPIIGIENIEKYWLKHAREIASFEGLQQRTVKLEELGKYIIEHSAHIAIWRSGEHSGVNTGKHIRIWVRQPDGRIKTRILASAYDK